MPPQAFAEECWRKYAPYIRKLLQYKLASMPDLIEDCLNDTFLALLTALERGEEIEKPKAWLTVTAGHIIKKTYDMRRRELERRAPEGETLLYELPAPEPPAEERFTEAELLAAKDDFLASLSEAERTLYELRFLKGMKLKRIAALTGVTENNVKQRVFRLKRKAAAFVKAWSNEHS